MIFFLLWPNILSFVEKVFKVLVLIVSWISQRDKSNKQPQQASINSWLQLGLPLYIIYMRLCMIVSLIRLKDSLLLKWDVHVNTSPGICTTHHLNWDIVQLYSSKNNFLTNSVGTRTDPDHLVSGASWSVSVPFLWQDICEEYSKWECYPGSAGSCFVETTSYPLTTYKYINFYTKISVMHVHLLLSSWESTVTIQQLLLGDFDRGYNIYCYLISIYQYRCTMASGLPI